VFDYNEPSVAA